MDGEMAWWSGDVVWVCLVPEDPRAVTCADKPNMTDRKTGSCKCAPQYGSSDGLGNYGSTGDCGNINALWQYPFPLPDNPTDAATPYD